MEDIFKYLSKLQNLDKWLLGIVIFAIFAKPILKIVTLGISRHKIRKMCTGSCKFLILNDKKQYTCSNIMFSKMCFQKHGGHCIRESCRGYMPKDLDPEEMLQTSRLYLAVTVFVETVGQLSSVVLVIRALLGVEA